MNTARVRTVTLWYTHKQDLSEFCMIGVDR